MDRKLVMELATGRFVAQAENVLLFGPPGVGETLLAKVRSQSNDGIGLPWFVERELRAYLDCDILENGFLRVRSCSASRANASSSKVTRWRRSVPSASRSPWPCMGTRTSTRCGRRSVSDGCSGVAGARTRRALVTGELGKFEEGLTIRPVAEAEELLAELA